MRELSKLPLLNLVACGSSPYHDQNNSVNWPSSISPTASNGDHNWNSGMSSPSHTVSVVPSRGVMAEIPPAGPLAQESVQSPVL